MTKPGRKDKWSLMEMPDKLILVEGWCRDGLTEEQIAANLGISVALLNKWKKRHPEFKEALKRGKEPADREVENALFKAAKGYDYYEETVTTKGEVVQVRKYQPPNITAAIFWLKNRKPHEWRDKQEHKVDMTQQVIIVEDLDAAE